MNTTMELDEQPQAKTLACDADVAKEVISLDIDQPSV